MGKYFMQFMTVIKGAICAASLAVFATGAQAATVAAVKAAGEATFGQGLTDTGAEVEALKLEGDFAAFLDLDVDPFAAADYTFSAQLDVDGSTIIDDSFTEFTTGIDILADALFAVDLINAFLPGVLGKVLDEALDGSLAQTEIAPDLWLGLDFDITDTDSTAVSAEGSFVAVLSGGQLADPNEVFGFIPAVSFAGAAEISADFAAVPLPASAPMLGFALLGLMAWRRRARS
jgi:hypothetical protein